MTPVPIRIGLIGIGNMGFGMAARLRELGWPVAVHDIDPAPVVAAIALGATPCVHAAELASRCDCVILVVVDAAQVDAVLFGAEGVLAARPLPQAVMLCPTIAPQDTERCATRLAEHGIACIDAPVSGGPARAREGSMSLMVACENRLFERHRGLFDALSSQVFRISERVGDGARTKLVNNLLAGVNLAAAAEALALAERMGLDLACTLDVIEQSSGQSWIGSDRMHRAIAGDLAPRAHTSLQPPEQGHAAGGRDGAQRGRRCAAGRRGGCRLRTRLRGRLRRARRRQPASTAASGALTRRAFRADIGGS